jgi:hypothetical protein
VLSEDRQVFSAGRAKLAFGRIQLRSKITLESEQLNYGALHLGDHNINGGVAEYTDNESYQNIIQSAVERFKRADFTGVARVMERHFGESNYSLQSLFRDEQRKVLETILAANLHEAETLYRQIYERHVPLMRLLTDLSIPLPRGFSAAAEFVFNNNLRTALEQPSIDSKQVLGLFETAKIEGVSLDNATLEFAYRQTLERAAAKLAAEPSLTVLQQLRDAADFLQHLPFAVNLWQVQNIFYELLQQEYPVQRETQTSGNKTARRWIACFEDLGRILGIKISQDSH